ncbi:MAG TPA: hypothetical protein VIE38_14625 [Gaiellaceae bacterium]|jgi:hypothetical protein
MPAESERLRRRVERRDLWFIGAVAALVVALAPVAVVMSERGHHALPAGCKTVMRAGFTGGETHVVCASP